MFVFHLFLDILLDRQEDGPGSYAITYDKLDVSRARYRNSDGDISQMVVLIDYQHSCR